jgi:hypothetical protein
MFFAPLPPVKKETEFQGAGRPAKKKRGRGSTAGEARIRKAKNNGTLERFLKPEHSVNKLQ